MELEKLIKTRSSIRRAATNLMKVLESEIGKNTEMSTDIIEETVASLIDKETSLYRLDSEIENLCEIENLDKEIDSRENYKEKIITWKTRANRILRKHPENISSVPASNINDNIQRSAPSCTIKLPRLQVCKFDGNILNFENFYEQFKTSIHENETLNNVEKFNYLKSCLIDEAESAIRGLSLNSENYLVAIDILKERFGRKELIVDAHMSKLLNLKPVRKSYDILSLRRLYSECEINIRGLQNLGIETNAFGCLLYPILLKRIPNDLSLQFTRQMHDKKESKINDLLKFLKTEIECRERNEFLSKETNDTEFRVTNAPSFPNTFEKTNAKYDGYKNKNYKTEYPRKETFRSYNKTTPSASALHSATESGFDNTCIFCNDATVSHTSENCPLGILERKSKLMKQAKCFLCLKRGHRVWKCAKKDACEGGKKHNKLICDCPINKKQLDVSKESIDVLPDEAPQSNICASVGCDSLVFLQTVRGEIINNKKTRTIRILCDLGSTKSFCLRKCAQEMDLEVVNREPVKVFSFGEKNAKIESKEKVKIKLRNPLNKNQTFCLEAILSDIITNAKIPVPSKEIELLCREKGIQLAEGFSNERDDCEISILIGSDFLWDFYTGKVKRFSENLVAVETRFGYCLSGTQNFYAKEAIAMHITTENTPKFDNILSEQIAKFWELDSLGITDNTVEPVKTDNDTLNEFQKTIQFENDRYTVKLPWNEHANKLKDNYAVAEMRLTNQIRKFDRDLEYYNTYDSVIKKHVLEGIAEYVFDEGNITENKRTYYMPHHAVIKKGSSTPFRLVYDASSHCANALSLNDCLESGPNLNPEILALLLQFREKQVGITADIQRAFLEIALSPEDRDSVRFLWFKEGYEKGKPLNIQILRMARVLFGAKPSPFLLAATLKFHFKKFESIYPYTCNLLNSQLYVDDFISGSDSEGKALDVYKEVKHILKEGGFNMRKWRTNVKELQDEFDKRENVNEPVNIEGKILGYVWNTEMDTLELHLENRLKILGREQKRTTKRELIKIASKIFDPCGFITPYTIRPKILMQDIWKIKIKWDEYLPPDIQKEWLKWNEEIDQIHTVKIPRTYFKDVCFPTDLQLHCFVDASTRAYGAVLYIRYVNTVGQIETTFVCSKARVAPLKKLTLPRLELMSALLGSRLSEYVRNSVKILKSCDLFFWTDSMIVLNWIQNSSKKLKTFVQNRVNEIKKNTNANSWKHCPGASNPADLLTRGLKLIEVSQDENWWLGPTWLTKELCEWPSKETGHCETEDLDLEVESITSFLVKTETVTVFDISKFNNLKRVLRVTAWINRFIYNVRNSLEKRSGNLKAEEIQLAETYWIRKIQELHFPEETVALKQNKPFPKKSRIMSMMPFFDDEGIIRIGGRLQHSDLNYDEVHPVIIPDESHFSDLLIEDTHKRIGHAGVAGTLTEIRGRFWILRGRQKIKKIIFKCQICHRWKAKPYTQDIAPLPSDRITEALPFEVTGIDFCGPLYSRDQNKVYIALFTCAVTRAIHLEVVPDLKTESFLLAFRRFVSRRGVCRVIYSDNAKTFKKADKEIQKLWDLTENSEVQEYFSSRRIKWKYIVERAASWGGFWERMVRSVKSCLKKMLWRAHLSYQELETVLTEVEAIINSRPLTFLYSDNKEPSPLCPGHFLVGKRLTALPSGKIKLSQSKDDITRRYRYRLKLLDGFWKRWRKQYLLDLKSAHESQIPKSHQQSKKGDIVIIHDDHQPRILWRMGIITEVHPGRDGKVRACTLRLANGTFLRRSVQHLYPLEMDVKGQEIYPLAREDVEELKRQ